MKFRGKICNYVSIKNFAQLLQALSKVAKQMVFRISRSQVIFVLSEREVKANGVTSWCEFAADKLFTEYIMDGHSAENNEIYLEISLEYLASVLSSLKSSHNAVELRLKLTRKCVPCLTIEIETQMTNSISTCIHDIPVIIVPPRCWGEYQQPQIPVFDISLALPDVKAVRQTIERLRSHSSRLTITAKPETLGKIVLSADSVAVKSSVTYSGLKIYEVAGRAPGTVDMDGSDNDDDLAEPRSFTVDLEMKNVIQILPTEHLRATSSICSILDGQMVHFFYIFGDATLQYCIPAISIND